MFPLGSVDGNVPGNTPDFEVEKVGGVVAGWGVGYYASRTQLSGLMVPPSTRSSSRVPLGRNFEPSVTTIRSRGTTHEC